MNTQSDRAGLTFVLPRHSPGRDLIQPGDRSVEHFDSVQPLAGQLRVVAIERICGGLGDIDQLSLGSASVLCQVRAHRAAASPAGLQPDHHSGKFARNVVADGPALDVGRFQRLAQSLDLADAGPHPVESVPGVSSRTFDGARRQSFRPNGEAKK